jgi:uncharacterized protein YbjT (DUF2867 family)
MRVVVAGGHGKIARLFGRALAKRGDVPVGLIRNPEHADDLRAEGIEPVVTDLETLDVDAVAGFLDGADAAVFAAGAGPGSGVERKDTVDRAGSVLLAAACERAGVRRFLQVSSMGAGAPTNPPEVSEVFAAYLDAKRAAEQDLRCRDLQWTILRPGRLTDDPPTGTVTIAPSVARADVTRGDVAGVLVALLDEPATARTALEVVSGEVPITEAVRAAIS